MLIMSFVILLPVAVVAASAMLFLPRPVSHAVVVTTSPEQLTGMMMMMTAMG